MQILRHSDQEEDEELDTLSKAVLCLLLFVLLSDELLTNPCVKALQQMAISWLPSVSVEPLLQELETVLLLL